MTCPGCGAKAPFTVTRYDPVARERKAIEAWWCASCLKAKVKAAVAAIDLVPLEAHG